MTQKTPLYLGELSQLADLFKLFNSGKHLNRASEPMLWAELERHQDAYLHLFKSLGYSLRIDGRGFAWFHSDDASSNVNKGTRQLALLFMVLFDYQADNGKRLHQFDDWIIDEELLKAVHDQYQDILTAEELGPTELKNLLDTAVRYGFAVAEAGHWRLLPAVYRYLDHFEELAAQQLDPAEVALDGNQVDETSDDEDQES